MDAQVLGNLVRNVSSVRYLMDMDPGEDGEEYQQLPRRTFWTSKMIMLIAQVLRSWREATAKTMITPTIVPFMRSWNFMNTQHPRISFKGAERQNVRVRETSPRCILRVKDAESESSLEAFPRPSQSSITSDSETTDIPVTLGTHPRGERSPNRSSVRIQRWVFTEEAKKEHRRG